MSLLSDKHAETEIPLSPEERYEASTLVGRSLFSAMQLARLQEEKRNQQLMQEMPITEDDKVLSIPIPSSLMPVQKVAEEAVSFIEHPDGTIEQKFTPASPKRYSQPQSPSAYDGLEYDKTVEHIDGTREHFFKAKEGKGLEAHLKRNIGKYLGAGAGTLLAASAKGPTRFLSPLAGLSLGKGFDDMARSTDLENSYASEEHMNDALAEVAIRQKMLDKKASLAKLFGILGRGGRAAAIAGGQKASQLKALLNNRTFRQKAAVKAYRARRALGTLGARTADLAGKAGTLSLEAAPYATQAVLGIGGLGAKGVGKLLQNSPEILGTLAKGTGVIGGAAALGGAAGLIGAPLIIDSALSKKAEDQVGLIASALSKAKDNPIRMLLGGRSGFRDAKKEYYMQQKAQIQQELMDAQKEYIDTLSRIKTGSAEEPTPCVDAFCNGIAHYAMFGKTAEDLDISDDSVKRLLGDIAKKISSPARPAAEAAASGLLNTAAGSAYLTYIMRKQMREEPEKYMEQHLPTRVELQPY
jgi:hypothetical protein